MGIGLALLAIWAVILVLPATFFFYPSWLAYFVLSLVICLMALLGGVIRFRVYLKWIQLQRLQNDKENDMTTLIEMIQVTKTYGEGNMKVTALHETIFS